MHAATSRSTVPLMSHKYRAAFRKYLRKRKPMTSTNSSDYATKDMASNNICDRADTSYNPASSPDWPFDDVIFSELFVANVIDFSKDNLGFEIDELGVVSRSPHGNFIRLPDDVETSDREESDDHDNNNNNNNNNNYYNNYDSDGSEPTKWSCRSTTSIDEDHRSCSRTRSPRYGRSRSCSPMSYEVDDDEEFWTSPPRSRFRSRSRKGEKRCRSSPSSSSSPAGGKCSSAMFHSYFV